YPLRARVDVLRRARRAWVELGGGHPQLPGAADISRGAYAPAPVASTDPETEGRYHLLPGEQHERGASDASREAGPSEEAPLAVELGAVGVHGVAGSALHQEAAVRREQA